MFSFSSGVVSMSGEVVVHILCTLFLCDGEEFSIRDSFGRGSLWIKGMSEEMAIFSKLPKFQSFCIFAFWGHAAM
jgi:hypothetical protein